MYRQINVLWSYVYREIFVISLHTLTFFPPGLYISSNLSSHIAFTRFTNRERKEILWLHLCAVITPFSMLWCGWAECHPVKIFQTCSVLPSSRLVRKRKWGHGTHLLYCLALLWIFCAFCCKVSFLGNELQK